MKVIKKLLATLVCTTAFVAGNILHAQNNPVIENVPDAGVINYNGKYYLGGVNTNGGFYTSNDLITWKGPVHVFSMNNEWTKGYPFGNDQIHAIDVVYLNGKFHFYWSVNYWGPNSTNIHVGHAMADNILGPYVEPDKKNWFDSRIDPDLFVDSDSSLYLYTVKFTDGNTIWGQRLKAPWTHQGTPKMLFNALPWTWERMDNSVTEGPEVIKYRSKYYLMYNANHTGNKYGNYALGVAQADEPLGFNSGSKYPHPVVQTNLTNAPSKMRYVFANSLSGFANWQYTVNNPGSNWAKPAFNNTGWQTGNKGFGNQVLKGSTRLNPQTIWNTNDIWVRKTFDMPWQPSVNLQLMVNHAGPTEVFLDGQPVYSSDAGNYETINLNPETIGSLKTGKHILAIHCQKAGRSANLDIDLVDPLNSTGDDILYNPGQPNLIKGPNGFEWWLVYFGIKNGGKKGQFVNRVLFNNHQLTVDGPTGSKTPGYHPNPSLPVFGDAFDDDGNQQLEKRWLIKMGNWQIKNGELLQENVAGKSTVLIKNHAATNYLFKAGVNAKAAHAGIIACYIDTLNFIEFGLNKATGAWYYKLVQAGKQTVAESKLWPGFNFNTYHSLSVYKNGEQVELLIDDNPAPGNYKIPTPFVNAGLPGLFTQNAKAAFDGIIYTPGWDEYNVNITGWSNTPGAIKPEITANGIGFNCPQGTFTVLKGDLLNQYEFGTQLYFNPNAATSGQAGIYPVYADANNYLKVDIDGRANNISITGKLQGSAVSPITVPLKRNVVCYPNQQYSDHSLKVYTLKKNTELTSIQILKPVNNKREFTASLFDSLKIEYCYNEEWHLLKFKKVSTDVEALEKISFPNLMADAIRISKNGAEPRLPVYKIYTDEEKTSDYNLRAVKLADRVILFLDGEQIAEIKGAWPPSQVGLCGANTSVNYNGIMLFERN